MHFAQVLVLTILIAITTAGYLISAQNDISQARARARIQFQKKLEESLTSNDAYLLRLQDLLLYPTVQNSRDCYTAEIVIEVGEITGNDCTPDMFDPCGPFFSCNLQPQCIRGNWTTNNHIYIVCPNGLGKQKTSSGFLGYDTKNLLQSLDPFFDMILSSFSQVYAYQMRIGDDCYFFSSSDSLDDISISLRLYVDKLNDFVQFYDTVNAGFRLLSLVSTCIIITRTIHMTVRSASLCMSIILNYWSC